MPTEIMLVYNIIINFSYGTPLGGDAAIIIMLYQ